MDLYVLSNNRLARRIFFQRGRGNKLIKSDEGVRTDDFQPAHPNYSASIRHKTFLLSEKKFHTICITKVTLISFRHLIHNCCHNTNISTTINAQYKYTFLNDACRSRNGTYLKNGQTTR